MDKRFARGMIAALVICAGLVSTSSQTSTADPARATIPVGTETPTVTSLGPASAVTSTSVAEQVGDRIWTITSGVSPVQVGAFDPVGKTVDRKFSLPTGAGAWAMTHIGTDLYIGLYTPGDVYKVDTTTGTATKVAQFGSFVWSIAATPDGKIVAGTYPDGAVHEYDPATGATKSYGAAIAGEQYVRSIAADATTIYAGVGTKAHLIAIDRATGDRRDVLPAKYADRTFVATLALDGTKLAAGLSPTGTMLVFDTADLSNPVEVQTPGGDQYVTAITLSGRRHLPRHPSVRHALPVPRQRADASRFAVRRCLLQPDLRRGLVEQHHTGRADQPGRRLRRGERDLHGDRSRPGRSAARARTGDGARRHAVVRPGQRQGRRPGS